MFQKALIKKTFFLFVSLAVSACQKDNLQLSDALNGPVEDVRNLWLVYSSEGINTVEVKTPRQLRYLNEDKVFPDSVTILFYDSLGQLSSTLRSDSARYNKKKDLYTVLGNVQAVDLIENNNLLTSRLSWSPKTRKIFNEDSVHNKIINTAAADTFQGYGLETQQNFSNLTLKRSTGVTAVKISKD